MVLKLISNYLLVIIADQKCNLWTGRESYWAIFYLAGSTVFQSSDHLDDVCYVWGWLCLTNLAKQNVWLNRYN